MALLNIRSQILTKLISKLVHYLGTPLTSQHTRILSDNLQHGCGLEPDTLSTEFHGMSAH